MMRGPTQLAALGLVSALAGAASAWASPPTSVWTLGGRLEAGDARAVVDAFEKGSPRDARRRYLFARALATLGRHEDAARAFAKVGRLRGLEDDVALRTGDAWRAASRPKRALRPYRLALARSKGFASQRARAAIIGLTRALAELRRCPQASRAVQEVARTHELRAPTEALLALADCHEKAGDPVEAARRYDRIAALRPKSPHAAEAATALDALARKGTRPPAWPFVDGLRAARILRWAKKLDEAAARLSVLATEGPTQQRLKRFEEAELLHARGDHKGAALAHEALFAEKPREGGSEGFLRMAARCLREQGHRRAAAEKLLRADRAARGPARNGRDLFRAAELLAFEGDGPGAAKIWLSLARREKHHKDAPRAFVRAMEALIEHGRYAEARKVGRTMPKLWARRRIAWRIRWLGAWAALRADDAKDATRRLRWLEGARRAPKLDRMRARYWLARLREKSSRAAARKLYEAIVRDVPPAFYADLATSRLRALGAPVPSTPPEPPVALAPRAFDGTPTFERPARGSRRLFKALAVLARRHARVLPQLPRALALARVGLVREAADAMESAQLDVDKARRRPRRTPAFGVAKAKTALSARARQRRRLLRRIDRAAFALALVPAYVGLGDRPRAHRYTARFGRTREGRVARRNGGPFPTPFADLIATEASLHHVPETLLFAIMRQESAFRSDALSVVGARGLMQIMPRTGKRIADRLAEKLAPGALDEPALSLRYGAWYFWQLAVKYRGQLPLAIAAYNAGPKAVSRWLDGVRKRGAEPVDADVFLEDIPYTETRRYVRKVLRSMRTYAQQRTGSPGAYVPTTLVTTYGDNIDF